MWKIAEDNRDGLGFSAAGLMYGGLHALAWFAHFESPIQQLLWRISACVVAGGLPMSLTLLILSDIDERDIPEHRNSWTNIYGYITVFMFLLAFLVFPAYVLARAYLVVECFINLAHLPAGVYDVPKWSAYFPHIG